MHFQDEETSSIVPMKNIDKPEDFSVGGSCYVIWSNRKKYLGRLVFAGRFCCN